jgi:hypothetical protein
LVAVTDELLEHLSLTAEEQFILALAELHLMVMDRQSDPPDQKVDLISQVERSFTAALQTDGQTIPDEEMVSPEVLVGLLQDDDWEHSLRSSFSESPPALHSFVGNKDCMSALIGRIQGRDRAILFLVELLSFHPWGPKTKMDKRVRRDTIYRLAAAMPGRISETYVNEIDDQLRSSARKLARTRVHWSHVAGIAAGGAVLGAITGGLAAPAVGTMIGTYFLGLSGAAATSAGLAAVGGGALAAGGLGMAGGTAIVAGAISVGSAGAATGGAYLAELPDEQLFVAAVKADVAAEFVLLRERGSIESVVRLSDGVAKLASSLPPDEEPSEDGSPDSRVRQATEWLGERLSRSELLLELRSRLTERVEQFVERVTEWLDEEDGLEAIKDSGAPSVLVAVSLAEHSMEYADRISHLLPALLVNENDESSLQVVVKVIKGRNAPRGRDVLEKAGITNELAVATGGLVVDALCHPVVWVAVALAANALHELTIKGISMSVLHIVEALKTGGIAAVPLAATIEYLGGIGLDPTALVRAAEMIVLREIKKTLGRDVLEVAEALKHSLEQDETSIGGFELA